MADVANDLAFMLMDLEPLGHRDFADELTAAYLYETRDETLASVLDLYAVIGPLSEPRLRLSAAENLKFRRLRG